MVSPFSFEYLMMLFIQLVSVYFDLQRMMYDVDKQEEKSADIVPTTKENDKCIIMLNSAKASCTLKTTAKKLL